MSRRINHVWRCDICNSCTNPVRAPKCIICGTPAPRTRFGTFSHGRYVLVDLRTGRNAAEARIHELATDVVHIEELPAGDDLEERIADALKGALDDDFREARRIEAPRLASRARRRLKHEKQDYEKKQDAKVLKGDLFAQVLQRDRNEENAAIMRKQYATMRKRVQIQQEEIEDSETILIRKRCEDGSILCGINQCVGCTRQFFTKSFLGHDAAVLAPSSGEEPASPRHRAGVASMAWRTTRRCSTNAP